MKHSGTDPVVLVNKKKKNVFSFAFHSFFCIIASKDAKILRLDKKRTSFLFLCSTFRIFVPKEY